MQVRAGLHPVYMRFTGALSGESAIRPMQKSQLSGRNRALTVCCPGRVVYRIAVFEPENGFEGGGGGVLVWWDS